MRKQFPSKWHLFDMSSDDHDSSELCANDDAIRRQ